MSASSRPRIAILGGGPAGLAAAVRLSQATDCEITVYQMGWRVGGKGTSGYRRWQPPGGGEPIWNRIEEHGLHILFGFYENFFAVMRRCYEELARPDAHPLASFEKAFEPRDFGTTMYRHRSRWKRAHVWFRRNQLRPGMGDAIDAGAPAEWLAAFLANSFRNAFRPGGDPNRKPASIPQRLFDVAGDPLLGALTWMLRLFAAHPNWALRVLGFWQRHARVWARVPLGLFGRTYLLWLGIDYFVALLVGLLKAELLGRPLDSLERLDALDYRDWLVSSGIHPETAVSPFVTMIYHAAFSNERGEPDRPRIAAGSALRLILSAAVARRGAAYNRMRGGMGEVVFVPLFQQLRKRGVRFEFFHKVEALRLDATRQGVEEIEILRQARLADGRIEYDPLIEVKGVEAFPSEPLWDQLATGEALRGRRFESYYESSFPTGEKRLLRRGRDFDQVVLATPIGTLPYLAAELIEDSEEWRNMVAHVKSVQTLSLQLWFAESHRELGWDRPDPNDPHTLLSMYAMPLSTWAPMDQTLARENWPLGLEPRAVSYFTGAQAGPDVAPRPDQQPDFPEEQARKARIQAEGFVQNLLAEDLLEKLEDPSNPPFPRFEALHDPERRDGSARLDAQLARSNCEPSERVTLALPGSTRFRMKAGESGYENLVLAGDWIDNGIQLACMEGAFTAGLQAADAIRQAKPSTPRVLGKRERRERF